MMDYGYGMGAGGWIAMTIFWVALITLLVWAISRAFGSGGNRTPDGPSRPDPRGGAEDILDRRFAAGEIDEETYRSMRATLHSARAPRDEPR